MTACAKCGQMVQEWETWTHDLYCAPPVSVSDRRAELLPWWVVPAGIPVGAVVAAAVLAFARLMGWL